MISTLFSKSNEGAPIDIEDTCAMVRYRLTPRSSALTLNTPPSPPTYVGGVYTPPPYSYAMKEGTTGKKVGRYAPGIMVSKKNR